MAVILRTAAQVRGTAYPVPGFTSLWWLPQTAGGSTADATDCLARFRGVWNSAAAQMANDVTIDFDPICIAVEATTGVLQGAFAGTDPATVTGTEVTSDPLPLQTQGLLRFGTSTVLNGRRVRGRLFLPCPCENMNDSVGNPVSSYVSAWNTAGGTLFTPGATTSFPVVWHRPGPGGAGGHAAITAVSCSGTWSVLRSRR